MKRSLTVFLVIAVCLLVVNLSSRLKQQAATDAFTDVAHLAQAVQPLLTRDTPVQIFAPQGPDDAVAYLRFCLIPQKVVYTDKIQPGSFLLLAPKGKAAGNLLALQSECRATLLWQGEERHYSLALLQIL